MRASDVGLIITAVALLLCLRRRRCGDALRKEQDAVLMGVDLEREVVP